MNMEFCFIFLVFFDGFHIVVGLEGLTSTCGPIADCGSHQINIFNQEQKSTIEAIQTVDLSIFYGSENKRLPIQNYKRL